MALYAFDGTWNTDRPGTARDTNVIWFRDAYGKNSEYLTGIGTRFSKFGAVLGGVFGAGGRPRVKDMIKKFDKRHQDGDPVDVIGFSRGAALALDFVNKLAKHAPTARVRFLGLWDVVPAFGLSVIPWDPTWKLDLPETVDNCVHAMALDERRPDFQLKRPKPTKVAQLTEVWFRGVHSDIGGGNQNGARSSIALEWMFAQAGQCGVTNLDPKVRTKNLERIDEKIEISQHAKFWLELGNRNVNRGDLVHESVLQRLASKDRKYVPLSGLNLSVVDDLDNVVGTIDPA